jgi:hypothetical protein
MNTYKFVVINILIIFGIGKINAQCGNFQNSITVPAPGTINNCNSPLPSSTATICADFNISFSSGNASFTYGYTIDGTTTSFGPINSNQPGQFPNIVCTTIPCGSSITFFVIAYSNPNGGGTVCNGANATVYTIPFEPLPITLESFDVLQIDNNVLLQWVTTNEVNNNFFEIEHSMNSYDWTSIGRKYGSNTNVKNNYSYNHDSPISGSNYYRLKQVDFDGRATFSNIKSINFETHVLKLFPNPVQNILTVEGTVIGSVINIYDLYSKKLDSFKATSTSHQFDMSSYKEGMYIFRADNGTAWSIIKEK